MNHQKLENGLEILSKDSDGLDVFHVLFDSCLTPAIVLTASGKIVQSNAPAKNFLPLQGKTNIDFFELLTPESEEVFSTFLEQKDEACSNRFSLQSYVFELQHGSSFTLQVQPLKVDNGSKNNYCLVYLNPIQNEEMVIRSLHLANILIDQLNEGVMITDDKGVIIKVNKAFSNITGYKPEEVVNQTPKILQSGMHTESFYQDMWEKLRGESGYWRGEIWNKKKNGQVYPEWLQVSRIIDDLSKKPFYVGIFSDISERKVNQRRLDRLAFYDALTGLGNRILFTQFLEANLSTLSSEIPFQVAILFIDLDKFKSINDHYGHSEGDWVLREAAERISSHIRESDLACRFGGDEFVVVLPGLHQRLAVEQIAKKLIENLSLPYIQHDRTHHLTASVGISLAPLHGNNVDTLLRRADSAMYRAKSQGRNSYQFFEEKDELELIEMDKIARLIWQAVEMPRNYIEMHYQPIFRKDSFDSPVEYEALIRLKGEEGRLVYPVHFIEYAEQNGLISQLGFALFEKVCDDIVANKLDDNIKVGINLSAVQLDNPKLVEKFCAMAHQKSVPISRFNFEVTETAIMHNLNATISILQEFRNMGCHILLDDFGTGYASLSVLKSLPIDIVKIDQAFVADLETSIEAREMVKAMIAMSKAMNLKVLIEGVETEAQKHWLENKEVDLFQGYLLGKPSPFSENGLSLQCLKGFGASIKKDLI